MQESNVVPLLGDRSQKTARVYHPQQQTSCPCCGTALGGTYVRLLYTSPRLHYGYLKICTDCGLKPATVDASVALQNLVKQGWDPHKAKLAVQILITRKCVALQLEERRKQNER